MSGTESRDGWTDRARSGRTLGGVAWKHFGPSSSGTMVKTEALGLYGVGQAQGPQAWPGNSSPALPNSAVCTVEELGWR